MELHSVLTRPLWLANPSLSGSTPGFYHGYGYLLITMDYFSLFGAVDFRVLGSKLSCHILLGLKACQAWKVMGWRFLFTRFAWYVNFAGLIWWRFFDVVRHSTNPGTEGVWCETLKNRGSLKTAPQLLRMCKINIDSIGSTICVWNSTSCSCSWTFTYIGVLFY